MRNLREQCHGGKGADTPARGNFSSKTRSRQGRVPCLFCALFNQTNMIRKFIPGALALGLIATSSAQTPAAEAPAKEDAAPAAAVEAVGKPKLDPAVV